MGFAGRRVLVVDEEFLVALTTIDFLEQLGCEVVGPAASLPAALELAHSEPLDAAVLDMTIAGTMIWPVAWELRRRQVSFVFLSAYHGRGAVAAPFAATPCLEKPLEQNHLVRHLGAIWEAAQGPALHHA
jgi:CheY-like chemotaxis protein